MITLNLFESLWWDSSEEINLLKSVNKLCFVQNNKKVGKFSFFSLFFNFFQGTSKSGKISKPIFPDNLVMLMLFPRFDKLSTTKNTNATFFRVGGSIAQRFSTFGLQVPLEDKF